MRLHLTVDAEGRVSFAASGAEIGQQDVLLSDWQATKGHWIGAEIGLFATVDSPMSHDLSERRAHFGPVTVRRDGREA